MRGKRVVIRCGEEGERVGGGSKGVKVGGGAVDGCEGEVGRRSAEVVY